MARLAPERRTRLDLAITAVLVVLVIAGGVAVWWTSPARSTELTTAGTDPEQPLPTESLPTELRELWRAKSSATDVPAIGKATIVIADGGTVTGHDPLSGKQLWRYHRDAALCAAVAAWPGGDNDVLAVYRDSRGCSEVTALDANRGSRKGNRTSDADKQITLSYDLTFALAAGDTRLETWGSNLVRGIEYGRVDAPVNPGVAPDRRQCHIFSAISGGDRVALIERCERDAGYRLTILASTLTSDEKIREWGSQLITPTSRGAAPVVVSATDTNVAVYDGGADTGKVPAVRMFGTDAREQSVKTVDGDVTPPADSHPITGSGLITYWTGRSTVVLDATNGMPYLQLLDTLGPGETATGLLVPVPGAISVRDPSDGHELRRLPVDRGGYTGVVSLRTLGPYVAEQRGDELVVLGPPPAS
ncbi:hypothetical protein MYK68_16545 [Gordonia sp. PP30]|uniref:Rv3212 family protein n=1 Tax=unclassified Gordonia (in: high G+C Gram-positive bacteria) TaxID=2657482 RepID=UPI001FFE5382|nr:MULTISPECIES: hypothetical protein [unclassified Gordonia (in: high G+C Gram-positive bacteria)]UQE74313.1 hypothetical protein MYK68_16545 [Gordonia sp. PP30]